MPRPRLAAVCLALLVATAGCGGVPDSGDGTRDPYGVPSTETPLTTGTSAETVVPPREATGTPTTTDPSTPLPSQAFQRAIENHSEALLAAGNFTLRREQVLARWSRNATPPSDATEPRVLVVAADLDADRYRLWAGPEPNESDGDALFEWRYQNGTGVYVPRESPDGDREYVAVGERDGPVPRTVALGMGRGIGNATLRVPLEANGTTTFRGVPVTRYVATERGALSGRTSIRNVTAFRATVLVDDRGVIRKFEYVLRGVLYTDRHYLERFSLTITGVGNTTVRPPGTASEAGAGRVPAP